MVEGPRLQKIGGGCQADPDPKRTLIRKIIVSFVHVILDFIGAHVPEQLLMMPIHGNHMLDMPHRVFPAKLAHLHIWHKPYLPASEPHRYCTLSST
jgi:hypothetical protein